MAIGKCPRQGGNPSRCNIGDPGHPLCDSLTATCAYSLPDDMLKRSIVAGENIVVAANKTLTAPDGNTLALTANQKLIVMDGEKNGMVQTRSTTHVLPLIPVSLIRRQS